MNLGHLRFEGRVWYWKGPAPWYFVTVPDDACGVLESASPAVSYGWGMIPVRAQIGDTEWKTSLFAKDRGYVVPIKAAVRQAERIADGDVVSVRLTVEP